MKEKTNEELQLIVDSANSLSVILRKLGISETCPHNRKLLKQRMELLDLTQYELNKTIKHPFSNINPHRLEEDEYFCVGEYRRSGANMKIRLLKHMNWKDECSLCGLGPVWNGIPLSLQVDHINGNPFDNGIENLRLLCPNCHSQTETFGSKNVKKNGGGSGT